MAASSSKISLPFLTCVTNQRDKCAHRNVIDPHSTQGSPVVAEVVLNGRICHLKKGGKQKETMSGECLLLAQPAAGRRVQDQTRRYAVVTERFSQQSRNAALGRNDRKRARIQLRFYLLN